MRLINVETLTLEEFMVMSPDSVGYAILSHTWEDGEVTFQDFTSPGSKREDKKGFGKIMKTCELARRDGIKYAWVDTCCIDKTSSAELTEAINSMFNWYRDASVCYAWLADLPAATEESIESSMSKCRWFTRGWTLQELLAPRRVEFYDRDWDFRGTKSELKELIAEASQIGIEVLESPERLYKLPIAQTMSWAAKRQTTRLEDMAYCLIGIFEVNMPMLYGEGQRAFLRLQEEIVKDTNDLSIFAWRTAAKGQKYHGVFARSPAEFGECGSVRLIDSTVYSPEFSLGNKGLRIQTDLVTGTGGAHLLKLNCKDGSKGAPISIWIHHHGGEMYSRSRAHEYGDLSPGDARPLRKKNICILKQLDALRSEDLEASHRHAFVFRENFNTVGNVRFPECLFEVTVIEPGWSWDAARRMLHTQGVDQFNGFAYFTPRYEGAEYQMNKFHMAGEWFIVAFGRHPDEEKPWITIHGKDDRYGLKLLEIGSTDPQRMGRMARESLGGGPRSITLKTLEKRLLKTVSASLNEGTMDGQGVYFIDVDFQTPPAPVLVTRKDLLDWTSPHIDYSQAASYKPSEESSGDEADAVDFGALFD
ncbi:hypothetical protein ANO14919_048140 [Xylariales sp. No.14919]|nr:hypothetical protein ANO14919_048140 [Xylariales sp. No.14919]